MMGRVVADKLLPLQKFAPFEPLLPTVPRHNPQDIIPDILPAPSLHTNRKEILSRIKDQGVEIMLTSFFGINFARTSDERVELETQEVKQYALNNPDEYFDVLMENDLYAADALKLVSSTKRGHAYFVTGFLTASGAVWTRKQGQTSTDAFSIALPLAEIAGAPLPGLADPTIKPSLKWGNEQQRQMHVADEEIFAVAYSLVKIKYRFDKTASHFTRKLVTVGPSKRANAKHLALGNDDEGKEAGDAQSGNEEDGDVFLVDIEDEDGDGDVSPYFDLLEL
jgi:hypothetical protein